MSEKSKIKCAYRKTRLIKDFFNNKAEHWDEYMHFDLDVMNRIIDACDLHAGQSVLDAACGTGVLFPLLLAYDPSKLTGIDISDAMTKKAGQKHHDHRLEIITADLLLFDVKRFDRIILYNAYPHFFDKPMLALKIFGLLAADGRFVIAHNASRERVNAMHAGCGASEISVPLGRACDEAQWFISHFDVDICIDTDDMYIISGIKKTGV